MPSGGGPTTAHWGDPLTGRETTMRWLAAFAVVMVVVLPPAIQVSETADGIIAEASYAVAFQFSGFRTDLAAADEMNSL